MSNRDPNIEHVCARTTDMVGGTHTAVPVRLRLRLVGIAVLGVITLRIAVEEHALSAGAVWILVVGYAWVQLSRNHVPGAETPDEYLGVANVVTLFRGWVLALFAGIVLTSSAFVSVGVFVCAVALDAVDGAIARKTRETSLGARLDGWVDALTVLVGALATVAVGALPAWYLLAGGTWYAYSAALLFRVRAGRSIYDLPESRLRPLIGSAQFLVISVALSVGTNGPVVAAVAAVALGALLVSFARDWAAATGRIRSEEKRPAVELH